MTTLDAFSLYQLVDRAEGEKKRAEVAAMAIAAKSKETISNTISATGDSAKGAKLFQVSNIAAIAASVATFY